MGFPLSGEFLSSLGDTIAGKTADLINSSEGSSRASLAAFDQLAGEDVLGWAQSRQAQQDGNGLRADLYGEAARVADQLGVQSLPTSVVVESFESMSHAQIKVQVDSLQPRDVYESSQSWRKAEEMVTDLIGAFRREIGAIIASDWEGDAANRARDGVNRYAGESEKLGQTFTLVGNKMEEAYSGFAQTKQQMPEPDTRSIGDYVRAGIPMLMGNPGGITKLIAAGDEAHQEAIQVMNTVYAPVVRQADAGVPTLPPPFNPILAGPGSVPDGGGWGSDRPADTRPFTPPVGPGDGDTERIQPPVSDQSVPASTTAASTGAATPAQSGANGLAPNGLPTTGAQPDSTRTAGASPLAASAGAGSGGGLGGASGGFGGGAGSSGRAVPPPAPGAASGPGGAPKIANGGTGTGRVGMPGGMMPPGARGGAGDDEQEHKTPDYLINIDNGNKLIGSMPLVAPPVIGA